MISTSIIVEFIGLEIKFNSPIFHSKDFLLFLKVCFLFDFCKSLWDNLDYAISEYGIGFMYGILSSRYAAYSYHTYKKHVIQRYANSEEM